MASCDLRRDLDQARQSLVFDIDFQRPYRSGIPQTFSISVIAFTGRKFRSHWPSVTPSARVLVRFPLHVILSVEAAFPSTIVPETSEKMQTNVGCFNIATTAETVARVYEF
jgi:hypothetical protein